MIPPSPTPLEDSPYPSLSFKRDDLSPYGSHKFRYFLPLFEKLKEQGMKQLVLSTTGNAGITASRLGQDFGIRVICLLHEKGDLHKAAEITRNGGFLIQTDRPLRFAKYIAKKYGIPLLRASQDSQAIPSYRSLGNEIIEQAPDADAIVNFATSGCSTLGIAQAYREKGIALPAFHIVQSGKTCSVVKALHQNLVSDEPNADAVGLSQTPHHDELLQLIEESHGDASFVSSEDILQAEAELRSYELETSREGVCSFVVGKKLHNRYKKIVVIFSGKKWSTPQTTAVQHAQSFEDIDELWNAFDPVS